MRLFQVSGIISVIILAISACHSARRDSATPTSDAMAPTSHALHSEELRNIMNRLDALQLTSWPQELQAEYASKEEYIAAKAFWEARQLADGLAAAAGSIPQVIHMLPLPEADRRSFLVQVDTLREQAIRLERAAALGDRENMRRVLDAIDETCLSCHERFRDISGPLSSG